MAKFALRLSGFLLLLCTIGAYAQTVSSFEGIDASQVAKPNFDVDPNGAIGTSIVPTPKPVEPPAPAPDQKRANSPEESTHRTG